MEQHAARMRLQSGRISACTKQHPPRTFCLFFCTSALMSASDFSDSLASRFDVSPAFEEFCMQQALSVDS